jgi:hypothetical protein
VKARFPSVYLNILPNSLQSAKIAQANRTAAQLPYLKLTTGHSRFFEEKAYVKIDAISVRPII